MKKPWLIEIDGEEKTMYLIPKSAYLSLPVGTEIYSLEGEKFVIGEDEIDMTATEGYLDYGILKETPEAKKGGWK
ncbi:MAG: hypothetical protein WDA59_07705 [Methanofastidiosum sp.]